jgi:hypothetical protein
VSRLEFGAAAQTLFLPGSSVGANCKERDALSNGGALVVRNSLRSEPEAEAVGLGGRSPPRRARLSPLGLVL